MRMCMILGFRSELIHFDLPYLLIILFINPSKFDYDSRDFGLIIVSIQFLNLYF